MRNLLLSLLTMCLMLSCVSARKSAQVLRTNQAVTESVEKQTSKTETVIDTTKTDVGKVTITEIEFFPALNKENNPDTIKSATNINDLNIANIGSIKNAAIKSIKQTTIEKKSEQKGESKESSESDSSKNQATLSNASQSITEESTPAPDPYRWRYIFYILVLVSIAILYLKRISFLNWIKKILSSIRRIS